LPSKLEFFLNYGQPEVMPGLNRMSPDNAEHF
jgi:hypothetical protein